MTLALRTVGLSKSFGGFAANSDVSIGFEAGATSYGVGIRDVVVAQLARWGIAATIDSMPGLGTTVIIARTRQEAGHRP